MTDSRCETCVHWGESSDGGDVRECTGIDATGDTVRELRGKAVSYYAVIADALGPRGEVDAVLATHRQFGCIHHETR